MTSPATLPHLFGRFTAVMRDHADIGRTLKQLRAMCADLEDGQGALSEELMPLRLLLRFQRELADHFAVEEAEAYFGTVVDEAPHLGAQIDALKAEHLTMLDAAGVLCGLSIDSARWTQLPRPTRELITRLERHERDESALLRQLFQANQ